MTRTKADAPRMLIGYIPNDSLPFWVFWDSEPHTDNDLSLVGRGSSLDEAINTLYHLMSWKHLRRQSRSPLLIGQGEVLQ